MSKEKLQMDDWGSPDKRPSFYKFIWRANTIDLPIPRAFEHHLLDEEADMVTLRSPCGNWKIELLREQGYIYFGKGWKEFVEHHSLGKKEFLLFNYNGDMSFDVVIFDAKNLLEKKYPSGGEIPTNQNSCPSSFTSSFPFFKYSIKDYNVGSKSFLQIPRDFSRRHLPNIRQKFVLRNSKGICWAVSVTLIHKNLAISGGWKAFADDNLIKKGDVCVFELVEKTTLQVHVFK